MVIHLSTNQDQRGLTSVIERELWLQLDITVTFSLDGYHFRHLNFLLSFSKTGCQSWLQIPVNLTIKPITGERVIAIVPFVQKWMERSRMDFQFFTPISHKYIYLIHPKIKTAVFLRYKRWRIICSSSPETYIFIHVLCNSTANFTFIISFHFPNEVLYIDIEVMNKLPNVHNCCSFDYYSHC